MLPHTSQCKDDTNSPSVQNPRKTGQIPVIIDFHVAFFAHDLLPIRITNTSPKRKRVNFVAFRSEAVTLCKHRS